MTDNHIAADSAWVRFWDRGGWWRAVAVAVIYLAFYLGVEALLGAVVGDTIDKDDILSSAESVFFGLALPIILAGVFVLLLARSFGWLPRPLFATQPVRGRWWMWLAPVLVLVPIVFHLLGTDYSRYTGQTIATVFLVGLGVGIVEETVTRGMAVTLLRRGGYGEWAVMTLSSLLFALMHASNLISGQPFSTVGPTMVYTFGFGVCMYLTLRATGNLVWPILLHAGTDPTTILASGGIDESVAGTSNTFLVVATAGTVAYIVLSVVALFAVRGHAHGRASRDELER